MPHAKGDSPVLFDETNPPRKLAGKSASNASGAIRDKGSLLESATKQTAHKSTVPATAFTATPIREERKTVFKSGASSDL